jgi:SAM-dependent methyltransferase
MWTDEYISKQLLKMHLDPEVDSASRKPESIHRTIEFILKFCHNDKMDILDLGCGPGIYTEKLDLIGHNVTGIDFSANSIAYAKKHAMERNQDIDYHCKNYLSLSYQDQFDLIMLIFTDFGVLIPDERDQLLSVVHRALRPGGVFIFDVLNDNNIDEKFKDERAWTVVDCGFWRDSPYLELIQAIHYPDDQVYLRQHTILEGDDRRTTYRFWTHYYNEQTLRPILERKNFLDVECFDNVLPESDIWNGENVTFYTMIKP